MRFRDTFLSSSRAKKRTQLCCKIIRTDIRKEAWRVEIDSESHLVMAPTPRTGVTLRVRRLDDSLDCRRPSNAAEIAVTAAAFPEKAWILLDHQPEHEKLLGLLTWNTRCACPTSYA